jgi:uncharacterized membrane protein
MNTEGDRSEDGDIDTGRIEAFSDGVFAIAITLLVLEVRVPHLKDAPIGTTLLGALIEQWPSYLGYAMSFLIIGIIWANHHNRFKYIKRSDHILLTLNTFFLMCVSFIPFPTALLAEYIREPDCISYRDRTSAPTKNNRANKNNTQLKRRTKGRESTP